MGQEVSQYNKGGLRQQVYVTEDPQVEYDKFLFKPARTVGKKSEEN